MVTDAPEGAYLLDAMIHDTPCPTLVTRVPSKPLNGAKE
jgi:hypothetical protein